MKITQTMPEPGQFVAVWEYNGLTWSSTHKFVDEALLRRNDDLDLPDERKWISASGDREFYENNGATFIVMGEKK